MPLLDWRDGCVCCAAVSGKKLIFGPLINQYLFKMTLFRQMTSSDKCASQPSRLVAQGRTAGAHKSRTFEATKIKEDF